MYSNSASEIHAQHWHTCSTDPPDKENRGSKQLYEVANLIGRILKHVNITNEEQIADQLFVTIECPQRTFFSISAFVWIFIPEYDICFQRRQLTKDMSYVNNNKLTLI